MEPIYQSGGRNKNSNSLVLAYYLSQQVGTFSLYQRHTHTQYVIYIYWWLVTLYNILFVDELFSSSWCNIQGSEVEVLVLNFHTKNYTLPEFVEKMDKLKVLIVSNYGFFHSKISNFQLLESLPNLKKIKLEKVSISSFCNTLVLLKILKKISLFMCNIGEAFENCTIQVLDALPNLTVIKHWLLQWSGGIACWAMWYCPPQKT